MSTYYPIYNPYNEFDNNSLSLHTTYDWEDTDSVDENTPVEFTSDGELSDKDQRIADVFAANIINAMRKQIGAPQVKVSLEGLQTEKEMGQYQDEHHAEADAQNTPHMVDAMGWLANDKGIETAENWTMDDGYGDISTVADLKNTIARAMNGWISEIGSSSRGHYDNLIGKYADNHIQAVGMRIHKPTEQDVEEAQAKYSDKSINIGEFATDVWLDLFHFPSNVSQHYISLDNNGLSN